MKIYFKLTFKREVVTSMLLLIVLIISFKVYCCLSIIANINYFRALNISVNTTLKY